MPTSRSHTTGQQGPVLFEATTVAAHITVIAEDRPAALITVSTPQDSGPAADAVRYVSFEGGPGVVSVLLKEPANGRESTVVNRAGGVTVIQGGGAFPGTVIGAVFGSVNIVDGGMVFGGNSVIGAPISIEARLPLGSSLTCESTSGDVGTSGELVDVDAVTVAGDIRIDSVRLPRLRSTSGDIRVSRLTGTQAVAETVSGDIRIRAERPGARVRATSVSGDIQATGSDIDLDARTVSGRVTTR